LAANWPETKTLVAFPFNWNLTITHERLATSAKNDISDSMSAGISLFPAVYEYIAAKQLRAWQVIRQIMSPHNRP
jgi:hypothetical protein